MMDLGATVAGRRPGATTAPSHRRAGGTGRAPGARSGRSARPGSARHRRRTRAATARPAAPCCGALVDGARPADELPPRIVDGLVADRLVDVAAATSDCREGVSDGRVLRCRIVSTTITAVARQAKTTTLNVRCARPAAAATSGRSPRRTIRTGRPTAGRSGSPGVARGQSASRNLRAVRPPKDFFRPLAIGAPEPLREIPFRPSRVIHFLPASNPKMVAKVPTIAPTVDVLLANLEDAVPATEKEAARAGLVEIGRRGTTPDTQLWTRVNSLDSPWGLDDLVAAVTEVGDGARRDHGAQGRGPRGHPLRRSAAGPARGQGRASSRPILVHAILETARGVANVEEICAASPRMQGLSLGPADLAANRRMKTTRVGGGHPGYVVRQDPDRRRPGRATADVPAGPVALHDRPDGRRLRHVRGAAVLRAVRRHRRHGRLRGPVPQRLPARLRRRVEPAPGADRDRQAGVQPRPGRRRPRPAGDRGDGRRHRRGAARREDGGRRVGQAVQGGRRARPPAGGARSRAGRRRTGWQRRERRTSVRCAPRRSVLYMPAANARALEKAKDLPCDAIIFDLEDAVAPDAKAEAREQAVAAVASGAYGDRELTIRCNGLDTPWGADDLAARRCRGAAGRRHPEGRLDGQLDDVAGRLDAAGAAGRGDLGDGRDADGDPRRPPHRRPPAGRRARDGHQRPGQGAAGAAGRRAGQPAAATWRRRCSAAREAGKVVLDGVYNDVRDAEGFAAECRQGVELGFDGKTLVHPSQVEPANEAWSPTRRGGRAGPPGDRRLRRGRGRGPGRGHRRRPDDRAPPRRQGPPHPRPRRGDRSNRF